MFKISLLRKPTVSDYKKAFSGQFASRQTLRCSRMAGSVYGLTAAKQMPVSLALIEIPTSQQYFAPEAL
ncbi:MAG: hypothetical protein ACI9EB_001016 [Pseudomonas sp.]